MADDYYKNFKIISERERSMAQGVAVSLIRPKPLTVWEILIPVIFILNYVKIKHSREIFVQNQIFTKQMALDAALEMKKRTATKETVMAKIQSKTEELVSSVPGGIYSDDIRRQQLIEIDILIDHYSRLLNAAGKDYTALVTHVYQTAADYSSFLEALTAAEREVMSAAHRTLGSQADTATAEKIESIMENMRETEVNQIFSANSQPQNAE